MGATESKPTPSSQHVFSSDKPISYSESLVGSLQKSPETDSTRAKDLEHQIQARVTSELEKHLAKSAEKVSSAAGSVSQEPFEAPKSKPTTSVSPQPTSYTEKPLLNRIWDNLSGGSSEPDKPTFRPDLDSSGVSKEIDELKKRLANRKQLAQVDKQVSKAKEEVTTCLRLNDRRPLDCWQEVENFKNEVGRLETEFVDRNGG